MRSLMSSCGRGKVAFPFAAAATTACPSATSALSSTTCVVGTQTLAAWEVASCARTAGGSPVTGRRKIPVTCNVHSGARSREGVAHRPRLSIPSPQERVQNRTVERHLMYPNCSWSSGFTKCHRFVRLLNHFLPFLLLKSTATDLCRHQPQRRQRNGR